MSGWAISGPMISTIDGMQNTSAYPRVGSNVSLKPTPGELPKVTRIHTVPGPLTPKEATLWFNQQVPYENRASDTETQIRAVEYVRAIRELYAEKTTKVRARMWINNMMMRGDSASRIPGLEDVHVPEVYKKREQLVPRLEKAVRGIGPEWFRVVGLTGEQSRERAKLIQGLLYAQLDDLKFDAMIQPVIRCALTNQIAPLKYSQELRIERRVKHDVEEVKNNDGTIDYIHTRKFEEQLVRYGPRLDKVHPLNFFMDTQADDEDKALYIGDRSEMTRGTIKRLGEGDHAPFHVPPDFDEMAPSHAQDDDTETMRLMISPTERYGLEDRGLPKGGPEVFKVDELWGLFDLYGDGRELECVLTIVNESLCVRAQENFYDERFHPYAVINFSQEGFELFSVGPLDLSVRVNEEYDSHRQLWLHGHKLHLCPITVVDGDSDLPDNLLDVVPGSVFHATGKLQQVSIPDTLSSVPYLEMTYRRDIEEISGSPNIWQASNSGSSMTATESINKQQEGNERLFGNAVQLSRGIGRVVQLLHMGNRQFMTKKERYRILGKSGRGLPEYGEITPLDLQIDVDIEFQGLRSVHTLGMRATSIANAMTILAPYIPFLQDVWNIPLMAKKLLELTVGDIFDEPVIRVPSTLDTMMPAYLEEIDLLSQGVVVPVHEGDDDENDHLPKHIEGYQRAKERGAPPQEMYVREKHLYDHAAQAERKRNIAAAKERTAPSFSQPQQPPQPQEGGNMNAGGMKAGTPPPQSEQASPAMTPAGQNPGPPTLGKTSTPGRGNPISQTQDRAG